MASSTQKSLEEIKRNLPAIVREELDKYEEDIRKFRARQYGDIKFQKIRLQMGTYAQRQEGVQMQRIKIPYGGLTSAQLRRLGDVAEKYATGFFHLTTRQDAQLYFVKIETCPDLMRELADVGITTREACGNTIRNVTACSRSGTSPSEVFTVWPYADAFYKFTLRNPICQNMGRKFKVAFEGCAEDHAGVRIHDLGWWAQLRDVNGKRQQGFRLYVGGGLGAQAMLGYLWPDFVPEEEMLPLSSAIVRVFDRYGERKSRMQARMKFLIKKIGFDEFRKRAEAERRVIKVHPSWNDFLKNVKKDETPPKHAWHIPKISSGADKLPLYLAWKQSCVFPHRTKGFATVIVRIPLGDVTSDTARKLADIVDTFSAGSLRTTIEQNFLLRWVPDEALPALFEALSKVSLVYLGPNTFEDITPCPGADTCRLGITSAKGLATRLSEAMKNGLGEFKELAKDLCIKISGCPNSCAQHMTANIGFQGAVMTKDGRTVPAEMLYVGGGLLGEDTRIADAVIKLPSRNAPLAVKRLLELYRDERKEGEHFDLLMRRLGMERLKKELEHFTAIPSYEEDPEFYKDWGHEEEKFELQKGIKGECAGATVEEKIPTFADAEKHIQQAEAYLMHKEYQAGILESYEACSASAHVPLYTKLVDPFTAEQTIWEFENMLVRAGLADQKWLNIAEKLKAERSGEPTEERAKRMLELAKEVHAECVRIQEQLAVPAAK